MGTCMKYIAIARKWRPSRFDDLVGQSHVVQTLKNAILFNRVSHAYLFSGARGIGKTSVARIFAKALRCPNVKNAMACNECPECVAISEGRAVDVIEIDGASNNGVEAVRTIRENVVYGAASGKYKIYIIDEVHMLSLSAFNALLKTLEEPPSHVIFIFATTEVQKIPLTIISRCQRFEFRRLTNSQVIQRLEQVLSTEKVKLSEEALRLIASHSDGCLRDALSLLEQVLSFHGERGSEILSLDEKQVAEALGLSGSSQVRELLSEILKANTSSILELIGGVYLSGIDLKHFAERCLEEIRLVYLIVLAREARNEISADALDISSAHFNELAAVSKDATVVQVERMAQILGKTISQLNWASLPRFVLEMACVRMSKLKDLSKIEAHLMSSVDEHPEGIKKVPETPVRRPAPTSPSPDHWTSFVEMVVKKRPLLGALLSHANFRMEKEANRAHVVLAFPQGSFYEGQAKDPKNRSEIEAQLKDFFGGETTLALSTDLKDTTQSIEEIRRVTEAEIKKSAMEHPTVLQMKEILGAEIVDVRVDC